MNLKNQIENIFPLTPLQKGLLFHSLYDTESGVYFEQLNCRLEGHISVAAINQAWQTLINRHSILRTAIVTKGQTEPVQVVFRNLTFKVAQEDWRGLSVSAQNSRLEEFLAVDKRQGFAINRPPLMRVTLIRLDEESWQLIWSHHHLLLDGWSVPLLMRELFILHKNACDGVEISLPSVRPYGDFLAWLKQKNPQQGESFWREYMQGFASHTPLSVIPARQIPDTSLRRRDGGEVNQEIRLQLNSKETALLQKLARNCSVTLNTVVQGAWAILLNRYSRNQDIVYGITVSGRPSELPGVEQMIGPFINTLPLRVSVSPEQELDSWLQKLQNQQVRVREFEHSSLLDIQKWSEVPRGETLFESLLAFENFPVDTSLKAEDFGLNVAEVSFFETTNYPLTLVVVPGDGLLFKLTYDVKRFDSDAVKLLLEQLRYLLINMANNPKETLSGLSLLSADDIAIDKLLTHSQSATLGSLAATFFQTVDKYSERIALVFGTESLTYKELDNRSNQIARFLQKQGIHREKRVVICLERSLDLTVVMLGVVKAGGIYVPVDPNYPQERIEFTVNDCEAEVILTTTNLVSLFPEGVNTFCVDAQNAPHLSESDTAVAIDSIKPDDGAYVIYTSGSTGKPKGVLVTHNNVLRLFQSTNHWFGFNQNDVWTFFHSFAFDFSVWEIWGALLHGGRLVVVPYDISRNPQSFCQLIQEEKVTILNQTPSAFTQLLEAENILNSLAATTLRTIIFGGEALNLQSLRPWFERHGEVTRLVNMYGITETTVHVTYREISRQDIENTSGSLIGVPIPDLQLYILDSDGNRLPAGVTGEMYVGGAGVTRGYLNRGEQNKIRFIQDRFSFNSSARLYRSGDLGRFLPNGDLEYLGRIDNQVKIRGFRIEIGEIEAAISQFPGIIENIVVVRSNDDGDKQLIAYFVCPPEAKPTIEELRSSLQQHLPNYMVPSQFIYLDKFPLTSNGKIDRKALPTPKLNRENLQISFASPATEEEKILAEIWQKVLEVDQVGRFDNYFVLGGDSIRSIRVCSLAQEAGLNIKLEEVFTHPVLSELATSIQNQRVETTNSIENQPFSLIAESDREKLQDIAVDAYPLAQLQAGMLFHSDYSETSTAYNDVFSFCIRMPFDINIWQQAYAQMIERHRILRTAFYLGEFSQPVQAIIEEVAVKVNFVDLKELSKSQQETYLKSFIQKERENGFDWSKPPLARFSIHHLDSNIVEATFALHHAIMDGWSLAQFINELMNLYLYLLDGKVPAPTLPPTLQYSQFIALEQQALKDKNQRSFWQKQLENIPFTQLPRLPGTVNKGVEKIDIALSIELSQHIKALSNKLGVSLRTVLLAIHSRLLAFYSGETEIVTGLVSHGRPEEEDGDRILGLFLNTIPFRLQITPGSWIDLIKQTFRTEQQLISNRRFPLAEIQKMYGNQPLYESSFNFVHFHVYKGLLELRDVELIGSQSFDETNIPFSVSWSEEVESGQLLFNITYDSNEFSQTQVAAIADCCEDMCAALVSNPQGDFGEVTNPRERKLSTEVIEEEVRWVHEVFEGRVVESPDLPAVSCGGEVWTIRELNRRANQLARFLCSYGISADKPVGICLERSLDMVCAILAVMKAGGCYVPIDPHYPAVRILSMLEDSQAGVIITNSNLQVPVFGDSTEILFLDTLDTEINNQSPENLEIPILGAQTAYIIFTSGSTGRAKGIAISHQALAHHMTWFLDIFAVTIHDVILQKTPFSFDASVWEFWAALMSGAKLVMAKPGGHQDSAYLLETIKDEKVTLLQVVPTLLEVLLKELEFSQCSSLRLVFSGGEALKKRVCDEFREIIGIPLVNLYGPAETTIDVAYHHCRDSENTGTLPIGESVPNIDLYILDSNLQLLPVGTPGELYVGGVQLARGYWNAPKITAESFLPNPFSQEIGDRLYRTGDKARYLLDGKIEFLGRIDDQVKIRGFRIETSEIITVLEQQPWVVRAVTKAITSKDKSARLVAYVELKQHPENWREVLRSCLRDALPDYMVPALFVSLDTCKLLPNGKIDLNALPVPEEEQAAVRKNYIAPRNDKETILTQIWEKVLRVSQVGIEDDFFELGGDSILCLQIIAKARAAGIHFTPEDLFKHPQIALLTLHLQSKLLPLSSSPTPSFLLSPGDEIPLNPIQKWFFQQPLAKPEHWNQALLLDLKQDFDVESVQTALNQVVTNHQAFHFRFSQTENGWKVYLGDDTYKLNLDVVDLRSIPPEELSENLQTVANQFQTQLDLESGLLFRTVYFQTPANTSNKLLLIIHHLIVDGVSWRIILQDLAVTLQKGEITSNSASFAQWATQLNRFAENNNWDKDLSFWKTQQISNPGFPLDFPLGENLEASAAQVKCNFSTSETESLLYEFPRIQKARIQEILLTVLLEAVTEWTNNSQMVIALESHGRESDITQLDVFNSVGWFTSLFPFKLEKTAEDLLENLKSVKQQYRELPNNGFSYGLLSQKPEYNDILPKIPQGILFNYLGQFDENFPQTAPFIPATEDAGISRALQNIRSFQLEITGLIIDGKLQMRFVFSKELHYPATIQKLADRFYSCFLSLLEQSRTRENHFTPTDFPLAKLNQEQLSVALAETSDIEDIYPLAPVQEGMLFHNNYESDGVYLQQVSGEVTGNVNAAFFKQAWENCINHHPSLRASFILRDLPQPLQRIHKQIHLPFICEDWSVFKASEVASKWENLLETDRKKGFDLEKAPLMRLTLVQTEAQKWRFLWTHHHLLLDGWSLPLIFRDVITFYQACISQTRPNVKQPQAYSDFITWLNQQEATATELFWRGELKGLQSTASLGLKSSHLPYQTLQTTLSRETCNRLQTFARTNQITLNTLIQAAWSLILSRYSASQDITFGVTVSGRPPELSAQEMVGLFINTLPLRVQLDAATPLKQWLHQLRDSSSQINQYSHSRLVDIQGWSDIPRGQALFESILVYENYPVDEGLRQQESELAINSVESLEKTHYPVTLYALPNKDLTLKLAFQKHIGTAIEREQLLHQLTQVLQRFTDAEVKYLGDIGLLNQAEEKEILQTAIVKQETYKADTVVELFARQVNLTPNAAAVLNGTEWLTYTELDRKSNQIARALQELEVTKETIVAVYLERQAELLTTLLGVLKIGAAFQPLDPSFPEERLEYMLADSGAEVIITDEKTSTKTTKTSAKTLLINSTYQQPETALSSIPSNNNLAYIIYTSGSTGKPKGVQITHSALVNFLLSFREQPGLISSDTLVAVTTTAFDISILELFLPLIAGSRLIIADKETVRDGFKLAELLNQNQATAMQATPATWRLLLTAEWQPQKVFRALCGGEAMPVDLATSLLNSGIELWNVYGPTETTIWSTVNPIKQPSDAQSIGKAIANTSVYILDSAGNPLPQGIVGELYIGGAGVARGYRGKSNLTAQHFVPNPFAQFPGERLYNTGDLARWLPNGEIEFLGRADYQVKIRGYRIELGEIETLLNNHPAISQAIVQPCEDNTGDKKLVAYLVNKPNPEKLNSAELRAYVSEQLPDYMVPSIWMYLDTMPLTPNNKVDRRALPKPTTNSIEYTAPRNVIEEALTEIWQPLIKVEKIGVKNNFFDLGGHSLVAAQIHTQMRKIFSIDLSLKDLFTSPTIEKTAQLILAKETQIGRSEKIAKAFLKMRKMTPEEKDKFLQTKR
jgi:amino acid adenylation domain-containing protein/non-ribosomal peptide synthase protein (TIGR01720 family)